MESIYYIYVKSFLNVSTVGRLNEPILWTFILYNRPYNKINIFKKVITFYRFSFNSFQFKLYQFFSDNWLKSKLWCSYQLNLTINLNSQYCHFVRIFLQWIFITFNWNSLLICPFLYPFVFYLRLIIYLDAY